MEDLRDEVTEDNTDEFPPFVDSSRPHGTVRSARSGADSGERGRSLLLVALGVLIVVVVAGVFVLGGNKVATKRLNTINFRIDQWDDRIGRIEGVSQKLSDIEDQIQRLEVSMAKLNRAEAPLREQVEKLNQKMSQLESRLASVPEKPQTASTVSGGPSFQAEGRFYEVRRGDTLFRIANNHGLTVDELRSYNELEGSSMIYPGQRLLVVPANQGE